VWQDRVAALRPPLSPDFQEFFEWLTAEVKLREMVLEDAPAMEEEVRTLRLLHDLIATGAYRKDLAASCGDHEIAKLMRSLGHRPPIRQT